MTSKALRRWAARALVGSGAAGSAAAVTGCSSSSNAGCPMSTITSDGGDGSAGLEASTLSVWSQATPVPGTPVAYSRTVAASHRLFVLGGRTVNVPGMPGVAALGVYAYDPALAQWEEHPSLPVRIDQPNVAAADDKIYVLGGTGITQIYVYDPATRAWSEKGERPNTMGIGAAALASSGSKIYIAGGEIPSSINPRGMRVTDFASYDTVSGTWESLTAIPEESAYLGAVIIDNVFFTVGGSTEQREVARPGKTFAYDLRLRTWSERAVALDAVSSYASAAASGHLYIIGGIAGATGRINPETQLYDPKTDVWSITTPLDPPRFAMGAAALDDKIYVVGGVMQLGETEFVPVNSVDVLGR